MTHAWRLSVLLFPAAALAGAAVFAGCSGDDSVQFVGAGDAAAEASGDDATTTDAATTDTGAADGGGIDAALPCPTYAGADPYCKALAANCTRCSTQLQACDLDNFAKCEKISAQMSKDGRVAVVDCLGKIACARDTGPAMERCVRDRLASATPSAAQANVRQDVCDQCIADDAGAASCVSDFYAKPDGGPGGGTFILEWNDGIANAMDTACASGARPDGGDAGTVLACAAKFGVCAAAVITAALPKDACKDGG
jgi:hypothetical protein